MTIALALLFALAVGFTMLADDFTVGIGLLTIFGLFGAFTAVLLVRVALEYSIAVVRMAGDMARMRERSRRTATPAQDGRSTCSPRTRKAELTSRFG